LIAISTIAEWKIIGNIPLTNMAVVAVVALRQPRLRGAGGTTRPGRTIHPKRCTAERGAYSSQRDESYRNCCQRHNPKNNMNCMDNSPTRRFLLEAAGAGKAKICDGTAQSRNQTRVAVVEPE
jgi:hypothetical protein